jgi:hypothetical protein
MDDETNKCLNSRILDAFDARERGSAARGRA